MGGVLLPMIPIHDDMTPVLSCQKARHYRDMERFGLPTPHWTVVDGRHLSTRDSYVRLGVDLSKSSKLGQSAIGLRFDKKVYIEGQHRFPHFLTTAFEMSEGLLFEEIREKVPNPEEYYILINSAFFAYYWHAVLKLTASSSSFRAFDLVGEVSYKTVQRTLVPFDVLLRDSMRGEETKVARIGYDTISDDWHRMPVELKKDMANIRRLLRFSCCTDTFLEVSYALNHGVVFWGCR